MLKNMDDIVKAAENGASPYWFARSTLRFWEGRVSLVVHTVPGGALFVSSEKGPAGGRYYTVRACDEQGRIFNVSAFQEYGSLNGAHARAEREAKAWTAESFDRL